MFYKNVKKLYTLSKPARIYSCCVTVWYASRYLAYVCDNKGYTCLL